MSKHYVRFLGFAMMAAAASLFVLISVSSGAGRLTARHRLAAREQSDSMVALLVRRFAVLERAQAAAATAPLPPVVANGLGRALSFGLDMSLAGQMKLPDGTPIWLIPGSNDSCFVWRSGAASPGIPTNYGATCKASRRVAATGIFAVQLSSTTEQVLGVQPNVAASVSGVRSDGSTVSATLSDGGYVISTPRRNAFQALIAGSVSGTGATVLTKFPRGLADARARQAVAR